MSELHVSTRSFGSFCFFFFFLRVQRLVVVMAESTTQEGNAKCVMCGHVYGSAQGRQHGRSFKCWNCLNVEQTIRRHLGTTADLAEFSQAETENFFREAKSAKGTEGKVTWQTIRATLLRRMTESKISKFESNVQVEELPMSVLVARGWEEEVVRRFPSAESEAHGCALFSVPVRTRTWGETFQVCEQVILEREKQATKKKGKKDDDLDIPVCAGPSGKAEADDKKAERKQAQEAKKISTENVKIATWAAKCLGLLTQAETSLTKVIAKGESVAEAEQEALKLCRESLGKAQEWMRAAKEAVRLQDQNKEKGEDAQEALVALPCDASDVKVLLKQSTEAQKSLRESFPKPKAKAKAEGTGGSQAAKRRRTKSEP